MYLTGLRCVECGELHDDKIYIRCRKCGAMGASALEAEYDYDSLRKAHKNGTGFDSTEKSMWRYIDFLPLRDKNNVVSLGEGGTPLVKCKNLGEKFGSKSFYVLNEGVNPTNSFKDRGVSVGLSKAIELGATAVASSSAGNLGTAMSAYSAKAGKRCYIILSDETRVDRLVQLAVFNPTILRLQGTIDDTHRFTSKVYEKFGWFDINWALRPYYLEGMKTIAFELAERFNWTPPDWVVVPTGSGASIYAIAKGFKDLKKASLIDKVPHMAAIQPIGCDPLTRAFKASKDKYEPIRIGSKTIATGAKITDPNRHGNVTLRALRDSKGYADSVSDEDILQAQKMLANHEGIFCEVTSGLSIAGAKKMLEDKVIQQDESVVCIATSLGTKELDVVLRNFTAPASVPFDYEVIARSIG